MNLKELFALYKTAWKKIEWTLSIKVWHVLVVSYYLGTYKYANTTLELLDAGVIIGFIPFAIVMTHLLLSMVLAFAIVILLLLAIIIPGYHILTADIIVIGKHRP